MHSSDLDILAIDLYSTGHHVRYLEYLVEYWHTNDLKGSLTIAVSPLVTKQTPFTD